MKIMAVDDDMDLSEVISFVLRRAGFQVATFNDPRQALARWTQENPNLILLDISMPHMDGLEVCRQLRSQTDLPIIMLTVRDDEDDIVRALEIGADDYITKPFSPKELIARVKAVLRRASTAPSTDLSIGDWALDIERHEIKRPGQAGIRLTPLEFRCLHHLMLNRGRVLPGDTLLDLIWGYTDRPGDRALLKSLVRRLRMKIEPDPQNPRYLKTVPGIGYTLELPDDR